MPVSSFDWHSLEMLKATARLAISTCVVFSSTHRQLLTKVGVESSAVVHILATC